MKQDQREPKGLHASVLPIPLGTLLAGYVSLALADVRAARRGLVPRCFARHRPPQMLLPAAALLALLVLRLRRTR